MEVTASALLRENLVAVGVDNPEPLSERRLRVQVNDEIIHLGEQAGAGDVLWDTFYAFDSDSGE
jgi:hypothetical protein